MSGPVVFLGPTRGVAAARRLLDADYRGPAERGDVLRATRDGATSIGLVDGRFHTVRSVQHKEILLALGRGVPVYGAASMGALRAAELDGLGVTGVGAVFEAYRTGALTDDDEVAIVHGPAERGYEPWTDAMVDIRDACDAAVIDGVVTVEDARRIVGIAKALHYAERTWSRIAARAVDENHDAGAVARLVAFAADRPPRKRRDAEAMLRRMASDGARSIAVAGVPHLSRTIHIVRLAEECGLTC